MRPLVICGAGGFGREVVETVRAINAVEPTWELRGVVDDAPDDLALSQLARLGVPVLGPVSALTDVAEGGAAVIAIGAAAVREAIAEAHASTQWATLVHPDTTVSHDVDLAPGTIISAGARLNTNIVAGPHLHVDQNVTVGHDGRLGAFVRLNPQSCISGCVTIGDRTLVGANATVLQYLTVGAGSTVGAGAVVTRDVADGVVVKGVPAR